MPRGQGHGPYRAEKYTQGNIRYIPNSLHGPLPRHGVLQPDASSARASEVYHKRMHLCALSARKSEMSEPIQPEFNPGFLPPGRVVLGTGLEPAHLTATASKTVVSAIPPPERTRSRKIEARRSKLRRAGASAEIVAIAPQWSAGTWAPGVLPCAARIPPPAPGSPPQAMRRCPAGRPSSHTFPGERHFARGCPHRTGSARAETP